MLQCSPLLHQALFLSEDRTESHSGVHAPPRRCCICSANDCKFIFITVLVWLADVIALFLEMWLLSWYQFCVLLTLEERTVGFVLFLQVLALLSVLHCLPPAGHVEPVFSDSVLSAAVRRNNSELYNTEKKALFATCSPPVVHLIFFLWKQLPHFLPSSPPSLSHVYHISAFPETCREDEGRRNGGRSK